MQLKPVDFLVDFEAPVRRLRPLCYGCDKPVSEPELTGKYCERCFDEVTATQTLVHNVSRARRWAQFADRACTMFLTGVVIWFLVEIAPRLLHGSLHALAGGR